MTYELKFKIKRSKTVAMSRAEKRLGTRQLFSVESKKKYNGKNVYITPEGSFETKTGRKLAIYPGKCATLLK